MAAETGFLIEEKIYPVPPWDTFTMDEAQVLYDYCSLTVEDVAASADDDASEIDEKMRNPGFLRALMHVAYQRGNPKMPQARVNALIGSAQLIGALEPLLEELAAKSEDDALPPASTTEPDRSSPNGSVESSESSGNDSEKSSDEPASPLAAITTPESDMSSISPQTSSVA